jgi:hypothetical protein
MASEAQQLKPKEQRKMTKAINLMLHCGGENISRTDLGTIGTPEATETFMPVAHADYVDMVQDELENVGLRVIAEAHGVTRTSKNTLENGGGNYFGMLQVVGANAFYEDHALVVGLRNSHVKRLPMGLATGSGVFVCDNLAFMGDVVVSRKHTSRALDEQNGIRPLIVDAIGKVLSSARRQEEAFEAYKGTNLRGNDAERLMIDMLRTGIVTRTQLPGVVQQWDEPDHEEFARNRNVWRLFNATTEALKGTSGVYLPGRTAKLHGLMDEFVGLAANDEEDCYDAAVMGMVA